MSILDRFPKPAADSLTRRYFEFMKSRLEMDLASVPQEDFSLVETVQDLAKEPAGNWWNYAFLHEPLRNKIPPEEQRGLFQEAWAWGWKVADECKERYGSSRLSNVVNDMGLTLEKPEGISNSSRVLFAEYIPPSEVRVYRRGIREGKKLLGQPGILEALGGHAPFFDVLLAHELYHVTEERDPNGSWTQTYRYPLWGIGSHRYCTSIGCLSEIAAAAFSMRFVKVDWSPFLLDGLLLYGISAEAGASTMCSMLKTVQVAKNLS